MTDQPGRYAIVLTHNRPALLAECVAAIAPQVDMVLVVDNASDPPATVTGDYDNVIVVYDPSQPPNLARLWNRALNSIAKHQPAHVTAWDVAVLCDDAIVPDGWVNTVSVAMRGHGAAAGCTHSIRALDAPLLKTTPDTDIYNRMPGWAFMLRGEAGLRADETMHWWWLDTSIDFEARVAGGMVIAAGPVVPNVRPNDHTNNVPGLAHRAGLDREAFRAKHGSVPW